jgi:hypothetical protein
MRTTIIALSCLAVAVAITFFAQVPSNQAPLTSALIPSSPFDLTAAAGPLDTAAAADAH